MGGRQVAEIAGQMLRHGRAPGTGVAVITSGTSTEQEVLTSTLADIARHYPGANARAPVLMIVGETVALAAELSRPRAAAPVVAQARSRLLSGACAESTAAIGSLASQPARLII